jgi:hypothetical protein
MDYLYIVSTSGMIGVAQPDGNIAAGNRVSVKYKTKTESFIKVKISNFGDCPGIIGSIG